MGQKKRQKQERSQSVLLGLIDLYLLTRKPIGSNTLRNHGFDYLSSATIRNYFSQLEKQGFLYQHHSSSGRIPTVHAYRFYALHHANYIDVAPDIKEKLCSELRKETREIAAYLGKSADLLSQLTKSAVFLSSPRFDQDFITTIKMLAIDHHRYLFAINTNFGLVHTEILSFPKNLRHFTINRIEAYFHFRLTGLDYPKMSKEEEEIGNQFYNEILVRYIVKYSNFHTEDIYKTGFSHLLHFPEFCDASVLATSLSLFENSSYIRQLLNHCCQTGKLKCWIGDDLDLPQVATLHSSVIAIPYSIQGKIVGSVALLAPIPSPYPKLFSILHCFATLLNDNLTRNLCKYQISYRQPSTKQLNIQENCADQFAKATPLQIVDQSEEQEKTIKNNRPFQKRLNRETSPLLMPTNHPRTGEKNG